MNQTILGCILCLVSTAGGLAVFAGTLYSQELDTSPNSQSLLTTPRLVQSGLQWGDQMEGLSIAVHTPAAEYTQGAKVMLTCFIKNNSDREVTIPERRGGVWSYELQVSDASKAQLPLRVDGNRTFQRSLEYHSYATLSLKPGKVNISEINIPLNERYDISPLGEYSIVVRRWVPKLNSSSEFVELSSKPARIQIVSKH